MARVWIEDRTTQKSYRDAVTKAKEAKRKPPGRWRVRWYNPAGDPKSKTYDKKPAAESKVVELENQLGDGTYRDPKAGKIKLSEVIPLWLKAETSIKRSTRTRYQDLVNLHIMPKWGDTGASSIDYDDYAAWLARLQEPKIDGGKALGASQVRLIHSVMTAVLDWCVPKRLAFNPVKGVPLPKRPPSDHVYLSYNQVEALAIAANELTTKHDKPTAAALINRALILLLAYTGVRCGEALAIRVRCVDLVKRRIRIVTAFNEDKGELYEDTPKTGQFRTVPIPVFLVPILKPLIDGRGPDVFLFTTKSGKPLRLRNWRNREFNKARTAAKLDGIGLTPHKLRHTAASLAIAAGADVYVVQRMLGHAKPSITLDVYGHLWPDRLDEVADIMDARRTKALDLAA